MSVNEQYTQGGVNNYEVCIGGAAAAARQRRLRVIEMRGFVAGWVIERGRGSAVLPSATTFAQVLMCEFTPPIHVAVPSATLESSSP